MTHRPSSQGIPLEDVPGKGVDCEWCEQPVGDDRPWKRGRDGAVIHLDCLKRATR
jgi:hypothetical protein